MPRLCPDCGRDLGFWSMHRRDGLWLCTDCWRKRHKRGKFEEAKHRVGSNGRIPWGDSLQLSVGEQIVEWGADYSEVLPDPQSILKIQLGPKGFLVVTNHRLAFLAKSGRMSDSFALLYSSPLEDIQAVSTGKIGWNDKLIILERTGTREFARTGGHLLAPRIKESMAKRKHEVEVQGAKERVQIVFDFAFLKEYMQRGGLALQAVKCTNCGAPMKLPEKGTTVVCDRCNTSHYVSDIFDRIRELIG